jgi:hypothetical protein
MTASHPFLGAVQHPPKTQTPPGCSRESCAHQLRARPRLWRFLQLRPRQPLPPSRFELRFGLVERCGVAVGAHLSGLAEDARPATGTSACSQARRAARRCAPMAQSPTVDGEVLPVLVDRRGEPEFTRGCDDRTNLDRDCDGCLRSVAAPRMGVGTWRCRRSHRWRCDRRSHHRLPTTGLCGVPRLRTAGVRTRVLLGIPACLRRCRPRCRLYRPTGTGLPWLCCASAARARRGLRRLLRPRQNDRVSRRIKSQRSSDKPPWDNALLHRARVASAPRLQGRNHSLICRPVMNACGSRHPAMTNAIKEIIRTM